MKTIVFNSPNHSTKIRKKKIKFIVIHYTGMQSERACIERLSNNKSQVSTHYLINRIGSIIKMVNEKNTAWHAGQSKWKNSTNLNDQSIGIELVNKGHQFGYENFPKKQISKLILLCKFLIKKYKIKKKIFSVIQILLLCEKKILEKNFLGILYQKKKLDTGTM